MSKRKICVVTGSRAEYGLLYWLMKFILDDPDLELQLVVTGTHLSQLHGSTYKVIEADGFRIDSKVEMLLSSDSVIGVSTSLGLGVIGCANAFEQLRPEILILLGDRYEVLAAAQAAMIARIPIAHLHGGESTEGLIDEAIRHSITKMSHLHFVAAEQFRSRVLQLGEQPERVFTCGALGLDNIHLLKLLARQELESCLNFKLAATNFLITYHPVTLLEQGPEQAMCELFAALDTFPAASIIFTKPNSDPAGAVISSMIDAYVAQNCARAAAFTSLGQLLYLSAVLHSSVIIGNSSSGLIEVPALHKPTVNIGCRQQGRLKGASVIDCDESKEAITMAIRKAVTPDFLQTVSESPSPYGSPGAAKKIIDVLKTVSLEGVLIKRFFTPGVNL